MGVEIERKFLVCGDEWKTQGQRVLLRQGYLSVHPERVVRVRIEESSAVLTIKGRNAGAVRNEWEYPIPMEDARSFLDTLCERPIIEKYRYRIPYAGKTWEVDEFLGDNAGLVIAEIELDDEGSAFEKPGWIGAEVTDDPRYYNANLLQRPYSIW